MIAPVTSRSAFGWARPALEPKLHPPDPFIHENSSKMTSHNKAKANSAQVTCDSIMGKALDFEMASKFHG